MFTAYQQHWTVNGQYLKNAQNCWYPMGSPRPQRICWLMIHVSYISGYVIPHHPNTYPHMGLTEDWLPSFLWPLIIFPTSSGYHLSSRLSSFIIFLWPLITYLPTFHCHKIGDNKYPSSSDIPKPSNVPQQTWLKCKNDGVKHKFWCSYGP